ncbi:hypothetical protein TSUD_370230 [Trifolium subterraneum]|uniref:Uncharacterized protein n=1 Tax=Trifolium subterraneum TaxID=3900 RepID=A0A2Z6NU01_TRISU|nr:hypothetical protein TSUD_370230 [Trifolium subterraneum]
MVQDSLDFERGIEEDNEDFEEERVVEDSLDFERGIEEDNEDFEEEIMVQDSLDFERDIEEDNEIAMLDIDLNLPAHHDFDLNE